MKRLTLLVMILLMGVTGLFSADKPFGVFVNSNTNSIQLIDPTKGPWNPDAVTVSQLKGYLGSYGGGLFDIVITFDGKTAIVSNFGDSTIYIIDVSGGFEEPIITMPAAVPIGFFAEDMDITPNDKYVLITDGGFSNRAAVVDIKKVELVCNKNLGADKYANAVEINPKGDLVLFADYFQGAIHSFTLDQENGTLTFKESQFMPSIRPVNVAISPDGQTAIAVNAGSGKAGIFSIDSENNLCYQGPLLLPTKNGQSCVFSKDGTKAYYLSNSQTGGTVVHILNVNGPGDVSASTSISLYPPMGTSQLFGVDTIALDPDENFLYVANPTLSGGLTSVFVVDLAAGAQIGYIPAHGIPTGIAFTTTADDEE
jgi:WD40 repeat protein